MIRIQNVFGKSILMCLIQILVGSVYDGIIFSKIPFKDLATMKEFLMHMKFNIVHRYQTCAQHGKYRRPWWDAVIWVYVFVNAPFWDLSTHLLLPSMQLPAFGLHVHGSISTISVHGSG